MAFCVAHFLFWYGIHVFHGERITPALWAFETWDSLNAGDPSGRLGINRKLAQSPGHHLVFVRYGPTHGFDEWVYNGASLDSAAVIWARDLGADQNRRLLHFYPSRTAWLLQPDGHSPKLEPYAAMSP